MDEPKQILNNNKLVYYLRWYDNTGKPHRSYGEHPEDVYTAKGRTMARLKQKLRAKTTTAKKRFTSVKKAYDKYMAQYDVLDPSVTRRAASIKPLIDAYQETNITELTTGMLQSIIDEQTTPAKRFTSFVHVKAFIHWAWKNDIIRKNIDKNLTEPEYEPEVSSDDAKLIEARTELASEILNWLAEESCPFHDDYNRIQTHVMGLRESEVNGLTHEAIDWDNQTIEVKWQATNDGKNVKNKTKNGRGRIFRVPDPYWKCLLNEKEKGRSKEVSLIDTKGNVIRKVHLLFLQPNNQPINKSLTYCRWEQIMASYQTGKKCSIMDSRKLRKSGKTQFFRPHYLRHVAASIMLEAGCTVDEIKDMLGHYSEEADAVYRHKTLIAEDKTARRMEEGLTRRLKQARIKTTEVTELTEDDMDFMTGSEYGNIDLQTITDIQNGKGEIAIAKMMADVKEQLREQMEQNKRLQERNEELQQQILMLTAQLTQRLTQQH